MALAKMKNLTTINSANGKRYESLTPSDYEKRKIALIKDDQVKGSSHVNKEGVLVENWITTYQMSKITGSCGC